MPPIDKSIFRPWYSLSPSVENDIRFSFSTYVRFGNSSSMDTLVSSQSVDNGSTTKNIYDGFESRRYQFLPKFIFERHEEYFYLRLIQDIISNGIDKGDQTGTGTLSKFGCQVFCFFFFLVN